MANMAPERKPIADMSLEDKITEVLTIMRMCEDALIQMSNNPLLKGMGMKLASGK